MVMQLLKNFLYRLFLITYAFVVPIISFASDVTGTATYTGTKLVNPLGQTGPQSIPALIKTILEGAIKIGIPVLALAIVYCGFLFVSARGNSEKLTKAKDALLYTCLGGAILLGSWAIATMISNTVTKLG
ncbi:hypothetical protein A2814_00370 [Candidatus Nomurabacteria bacterium RIFCSPHIGHO2_01_FULL_38_19]|uniref:Uncharacterized protein n=1 Tax=Candidatus Nomurabacteria bacterium RIFCSPHIGHO2_01_FULL_38_19 TaxID=1801732 RepID=A0A1F6UQZ3_9BACT|nr:MAG: hypothetical protein A2814_00370 [Candidatus Nomurabacteria bacterium RIFCSPHIGHO2_01_FULL_38_19]